MGQFVLWTTWTNFASTHMWTYPSNCVQMKAFSIFHCFMAQSWCQLIRYHRMIFKIINISSEVIHLPDEEKIRGKFTGHFKSLLSHLTRWFISFNRPLHREANVHCVNNPFGQVHLITSISSNKVGGSQGSQAASFNPQTHGSSQGQMWEFGRFWAGSSCRYL